MGRQRWGAPRMRWVVVSGAMLACVGCKRARAASAGEPAPQPPRALEAPEGCRLLHGSSKGNADLTVEMTLCTRPKGVAGVIQESGPTTGFSRRGFVGHVRPDGSLELTETSMLSHWAGQGWVFCADTRYELTPSQGGWTGRATSTECGDVAAIALTEQAPAHHPVDAAHQGAPPVAEPTPSTTPAGREPALEIIP